MHEVDYIGGSSDDVTGKTWVWVGAGILAVVLVMFMQWFVGDTRSLTTAVAPPAVAHSEEVEGGQYSGFALTCKAAVKMRSAGEVLDADEKRLAAAEFKEELAPMAVSRAERLRLAIVAGELIGKEEAQSRLTALEKELEAGGALATDLVWLKMLYAQGPDKLRDDVQKSLIDRHEWFGQLALAFGRPVTDSYRRAAVRGRESIKSVFSTLLIADVVMFLAGLGALSLVVAKVQELRTDAATLAVGNAHLEAFVLFCIGFVIVEGLTLLPFGFAVEGSTGAMVFVMLLAWVLVAAPAWPLIRGEKWGEFCRATGLHTGDGLPKEVVIGVIGFLAWTPVNLVVAYATDVIGMLAGASEVEGGPTGYPMFQQPSSDSALIVFLSILSSVVWAPVVEETVFRGLLYGWLRQWLGFVGTAAIVSIAFGIIHPYSPLGMLQVAAGGVLFAILREWRGSLIAPMVAHALHNGHIEVASLAIVNAIGG